jgi:hypothetical protein
MAGRSAAVSSTLVIFERQHPAARCRGRAANNRRKIRPSRAAASVFNAGQATTSLPGFTPGQSFDHRPQTVLDAPRLKAASSACGLCPGAPTPHRHPSPSSSVRHSSPHRFPECAPRPAAFTRRPAPDRRFPIASAGGTRRERQMTAVLGATLGSIPTEKLRNGQLHRLVVAGLRTTEAGRRRSPNSARLDLVLGPAAGPNPVTSPLRHASRRRTRHGRTRQAAPGCRLPSGSRRRLTTGDADNPSNNPAPGLDHPSSRSPAASAHRAPPWRR